MKSIGYLEGGMDTLIDALCECVGSEGTIVSDSFIEIYSPLNHKFWTNIASKDSPSYAGAFANAMVKHPNSFRSSHPVQKFSLIGKHAQSLAQLHQPGTNAYLILDLMSQMGAKNLKIGSDKKVPGVGTSHVAICKSKQRQLNPIAGVRYFNTKGNSEVFFVDWPGACKKSLYQLNSYYEECKGCIIGRGKIGNAQAKLTSMKSTLALEEKLINNSPEDFISCRDKNCDECLYTWEGFGISPIEATIKFIRHRKIKRALKAFYILIFYRY